ncbi:TetR/AcrR family transcriptional regulator [Microscilla marina]|uniref:Transcriptional regulator, TetR family n=1 Tax=Microscilla marina ATCC 23134 TaxID=313606 RepID=A1ZRG6_MICM2|nr:TetR/AcrR family transcriptional regulator [Microscilla marina]EAY27056.1 transcriptional regulator, TetR family [Microscilla marina ATCC 23134]
MKTKEKILAKALELFNQHGSEKVSTRHVADALGISVGNLYYHYKDKQALIEQLYEQLVTTLNGEFDTFEAADTGLTSLMHSVRFTFDTLHKYRFLMLDFVQIMRGSSGIKAHYQQLVQLRKEQFRFAVKLLIGQKMLSESIQEVPFDYLQMQFTIMGDFWISEAEILYQGAAADKIKYFTEAMLYWFYPYLTTAGKKVFHEVLPTLFEK